MKAPIPIVVTHNGNFHTDEVFAVATIDLMLNGAYKLLRTRDKEAIKTADYVVDVGDRDDPNGDRFDHHQEGGAGARQNGVPYSSFGLTWKKYGEKVSGSARAAERIDKRLVQPIDMADNIVETYTPTHPGIHPYVVQDMIASFRSTWLEETRDQDIAFIEAIEIACEILRREIAKARAEAEAELEIEEIYERTRDKRILTFHRHYPWEDIVNKYPEPLFIVLPDPQNGALWQLKAVRDDTSAFKNRKSLPARWAGKRGTDLEAATGVPGAVYCHNKLFIVITSSQEAAHALAELAVAA